MTIVAMGVGRDGDGRVEGCFEIGGAVSAEWRGCGRLGIAGGARMVRCGAVFECASFQNFAYGRAWK